VVTSAHRVGSCSRSRSRSRCVNPTGEPPIARTPVHRRWLILTALAIGGLALGVLFFAGLAAKERDNRFCVGCHLHDEKFERLLAEAPTDLAGGHHAKDGTVGCIACHGGADPVMRLRVWAVAGFDTMKFLAGVYAEPTDMRLPFRDGECRQCHTPILESRRAPASEPPSSASARSDAASAEAVYGADPQEEGRGQTAFHAIRDHDTVDVRCVRCHAAHTTDGHAGSGFLATPRVQPICRECHPTF
jgi:hypothetical protein